MSDQALPSAPWIGLGCAAFGGTCSATLSQKILDAAYHAGVRWFDTAPSYGFGESEVILGSWLSTVERRNVVIASKFGKPPVPVSAIRRRLRQYAGRMLRRTISRGRPSALVLTEEVRRTVGRVDVNELHRSVRRSLEALGTDYLDVLHLHSVGADCGSDELVAALNDLQSEGLVKRVGLATNRTDCEQLLARGLTAQVVQFPDCAAWQHPIRWQARPGVVPVTHSVVGRDGAIRRALRKAWQQNDALRRQWSERLGFAVESDEGVVECLLRGAVLRNPEGGVLFGVSRPQQVEVIRRVINSPLNSEPADELCQKLMESVHS